MISRRTTTSTVEWLAKSAWQLKCITVTDCLSPRPTPIIDRWKAMTHSGAWAARSLQLGPHLDVALAALMEPT